MELFEKPYFFSEIAEKSIVRQHYIFIIFCLILTLGILQAFGAFKEFYSDSKALRGELARLQQASEREKLKVALVQSQLQDFRFEVAKVIPQNPSFAQKNIFSQVRIPASELALDLSSVELEHGRKMFREGNYTQAISTLRKLIVSFPSSGRSVEARFLLAESLYLSGIYTECVDVIEEMITQFPENELTGFIMLRMGQILQSRNRTEEADEVYRTVQRQFRMNVALQDQARKLLRSPSSL